MEAGEYLRNQESERFRKFRRYSKLDNACLQFGKKLDQETMDLTTFNQLLTPLGQEILNAAVELSPREVDFLQHFQALSRQYPRELARAGLEIAITRIEAAGKFPQSRQLYFTPEALQQASSYTISCYRSRRYEGLDTILDLGCSAGGDSLALAQVAPTFGIDRDALRLSMAHANARALSLTAGFIQADLLDVLPVGPTRHAPGCGLFFDPARREGHRRIWSVEEYLPPLSTLRSWLPQYPALGVKISPGVQIEALSGYPAEVEFISLKGELKEAALWFGPLKSCQHRATLLPGGHTLTGLPDEVRPDSGVSPRAYLYEPDPAILRAGLVQDLAQQLDAAQLDPEIAYLTAGNLVPTPFARAWEIEAWFPFQLKRLRSYLRARQVGKLTVKKRGSPLQPETLIRDLRLQGEAERVVFLTHYNGKPIVIVGYPNPVD
jgi:SAM-dependent methyltransferase